MKNVMSWSTTSSSGVRLGLIMPVERLAMSERTPPGVETRA